MICRVPLAILLLVAAAVLICSACDAPTCSGTYAAIPGYVPSSNGCGSYGVSAEAPFGVTPCCNQHDLCYQSCNSTKTACDDQFDQCMKNVCNSEEELERIACLVEAEAFYVAVMDLGCRAYENNQQEACECSTSSATPSPSAAASPASSIVPSPSAAASPASSVVPSPSPAAASPSALPSASPVVTGACRNTGAWPDVNGCCPVELNGSAFYRDARGCYPVITNVGVHYADTTGCYPDARGVYLSGDCPAAQRCTVECLSA
jgi:secretory phospholipase A2